MIQSTIDKTCKFKGHQENNLTHICILNECDHTTRWCCSLCLSKGVHKHKKYDINHVMNRIEFHSRVMKQYDNMKIDCDQYKSSLASLFKKILNQCQKIEKSLIDLKNQYQIIQKQIQDRMQSFEQFLSYIEENQFQSLDDEKINYILNTLLYKFDQQNSKQQLQQPLGSLKKQLYQIEFIIQEYFGNQKNQISNNTIDLRKTKYITQLIDQTTNYYFGSSISKNERYLAYGAYDDMLLKIYHIKLEKIIKKIKLGNFLMVCQFTQDSTLLFVGLSGGHVYGFNVLQDFKNIYRQLIHSSSIHNIITLQNEYLITCSNDNSIIKTDIKRQKNIFKLTGHSSCIIAIDYNEKDQIIVSGSYDQSIILWNCKNLSQIVKKENAHNDSIRQIQLINNNLNVLSLDRQGNLYKWKIYLINKELIKLQQYRDQNKIFNFYYVNQDEILLLICDNYVQFLNQQGETVNIVEHGGKDKMILLMEEE